MSSLILNFGKFNGIGLEQLALGYGMNKKGTAGYEYFYLLGKGKKKYFGRFQGSMYCMNRWNYVRNKLNRFRVVESCNVCKSVPATTLSIAGSGEYGYSYKGFICCDSQECKDNLIAYVNHTRLVPIGFDVVMDVATKGDQKEMQTYLRRLTGFNRGLSSAYVCADFIDSLVLR